MALCTQVRLQTNVSWKAEVEWDRMTVQYSAVFYTDLRFETIIQITVACSQNMLHYKSKQINKKQMINNISMDGHLNAKRDK